MPGTFRDHPVRKLFDGALAGHHMNQVDVGEALGSISYQLRDELTRDLARVADLHNAGNYAHARRYANDAALRAIQQLPQSWHPPMRAPEDDPSYIAAFTAEHGSPPRGRMAQPEPWRPPTQRSDETDPAELVKDLARPHEVVVGQVTEKRTKSSRSTTPRFTEPKK